MIPREDIPAAIRATWPPEAVQHVGPFALGVGVGGGNRVSAAQLRDTASDGATVTPDDIARVAERQSARGDERLFMVFGWQDALDRTLAAEGYAKRDETVLLAAPSAELAQAPPPVSCFEIWPPLAVQDEIWTQGGIGRERCAIMDRAEGPKTSLFGRINDRPAGTAFIAIHDDLAMLHALEVTGPARRKGLARVMVRAGAAWARDHDARLFTVLVTRDNDAAQGLYASLGLKPVENYHYRMK